jgi:hypothetical protein
MVEVKRGSVHPRVGSEPPPPPDDPVWGETAKVGAMTALLADMVLADEQNDATATAKRQAAAAAEAAEMLASREIGSTRKFAASESNEIPGCPDSSPTLREDHAPASFTPQGVAWSAPAPAATRGSVRPPASFPPPSVQSSWPMAPPPIPEPPSRRRGLVVMTLVVMAVLAACGIAVLASGQ